MVEVQILIPVRGNDGVEFAPEHHAAFEAALRDAFSGWQLAPGLVSGEWVADGVTYPDRLRVYVVATAGVYSARASLESVVTFAKAHYAQLALYVRYLGVSEIV